MRQRVVLPTKKLVVLCEVPDRLILKRNDKLLDYDNAQYKLDRNRDPTRTRIVSNCDDLLLFVWVKIDQVRLGYI